MLNKLTGWQIVVVLVAGLAFLGYGMATGRLDAQIVGTLVALFGAWRAPTGPAAPPGAP